MTLAKTGLELVREQIQETPSEEVKKQAKAVEDLRFLCTKLRYALLVNVKYHALYDSMNQKHADFFVVHHDMANSKATFPSHDIDFSNNKLYIAIVAYNNNQVQDVFVFKVKEFEKSGLFSMFKKSQGMCSVNMSKMSKLGQYSFGNVIQEIVG